MSMYDKRATASSVPSIIKSDGGSVSPLVRTYELFLAHVNRSVVFAQHRVKVG